MKNCLLLATGQTRRGFGMAVEKQARPAIAAKPAPGAIGRLVPGEPTVVVNGDVVAPRHGGMEDAAGR